MRPMSMRKFARIVGRVMESLPEEIARQIGNIVVDVAEEPDEDFLIEAGFSEEEITAGETLFGYFEPTDLGAEDVPRMIEDHLLGDRLWIFKRPHEEAFPDPKRMRIEIRKTVIHELAHHFGWTDADLEKFDANPDPFGDDGP